MSEKSTQDWIGVFRVIDFQPVYLGVFLSILLIISIKPIASFLLKTSRPFIVVMSNSMQPTLKPGDLLVVQGSYFRKSQVGDILVFKPKWFNKLIIHRVVKIEHFNDQTKIFTKGDALNHLDIGYVEPNEIRGYLSWRIPRIAFLPYILWTAYEKVAGTQEASK
jgi:signal peptidase